ncbi:hypothetical protein D3C75_966900 [compost metagenome]
MRAASSISSGMFSKKVLMMSRLYALISPGSHSAEYELMSPSDFTTRYVGISPPENSMVKTMTSVNGLRPMKMRLDIG